MNIDLFLTKHNEAALICDTLPPRKIAGIILDAQTLEVTLEFKESGETMHLNIPVEEHHRETLLFTRSMFVGVFMDKMLADCAEIPLLYLNDPYGSDFGQTSPPLRKSRKLDVEFEQFLKRCAFAQSLHRANLGDEDTARSLLRGVDPYHLNYAPAYMRQRQLVAAPGAAAHRPAGPKGPGLGGGSTGGTNPPPPPHTRQADDE